MNLFVTVSLHAALLVLVLCLAPPVARVLRGPTPADRLGAIDMITTLLIGIIIMLALLQGFSIYVDVAIALAAFAFISTLALARYISEGHRV